MTYQQAAPVAVDLTALIDAIPDMMFILDSEGRVMFANNACHELLGWDEVDLGRGALDFVHPEDTAMVASSMTTIQGKPVGTPIEFRICDRSGRWRWVELIGRDCVAMPGLRGFVCVARDMTQRKMWELAGSDVTLFQHALQHGAALTVLIDAAGNITSTNNAFNRILGHDKSVAIGRPLESFVTPDCAERLHVAIRDVATTGQPQLLDLTMRPADPLRSPCPMRFELRSLDHPDGTGGRVVATGQDITDLDNVRRELEHLAQHDPLTGLANRSVLQRTVDERLANGDAFAVLFIDLDGFKEINDRFGHRLGDQLLKSVATRLALAIRPNDVIARTGGDEFVVVVDVDQPSTAEDVRQRIEVAIAEPFIASDRTLQVTASIGISLSGSHATFDGLIDEADAAMYARKRQRSRRYEAVGHSPGSASSSVRR